MPGSAVRIDYAVASPFDASEEQVKSGTKYPMPKKMPVVSAQTDLDSDEQRAKRKEERRRRKANNKPDEQPYVFVAKQEDAQVKTTRPKSGKRVHYKEDVAVAEQQAEVAGDQDDLV